MCGNLTALQAKADVKFPRTPFGAKFPACNWWETERVALANRQRCKIKSRCTFRQPSRSRQKSKRPSPSSSSPLDRTWCGFATRSVRIGAVSGLSFSESYSQMMLPGTACGTLRRESFGNWRANWIFPAWACFRTTISEVSPSSRCCRSPLGPSR